MLLDEATSAVDTETEQRIQEALGRLCEGRTTFIVAYVPLAKYGRIMLTHPRHRLSTIMNADRIMVITGGELVEEGSHEELIRANGKYAELWSRQIFAKPQDDEPTADKQAAKDRLVNDLPAEVTQLELAKVKKKQKVTDASDADDSSGSEDSEDSTVTLIGREHKKEV